MNFIDRFKHSSLVRTFSNNSRIRKLESGEYFYGVGSGVKSLSLEESFNIPEVASILNKRATAKSNASIQVVSKKTLEPIENDISRLLKRPNWFQSQGEFFEQASLLHDLYGNEFTYFLFPFGFNPKRTKGIFNLNPRYIDIQQGNTEDMLYFERDTAPEDFKYIFKAGGITRDIPNAHIMHLNDNRIKFNGVDGKFLKGQSKLESLSKPISNIAAAYESRGVIIKNRGALGILSNDNKDAVGATLPLDPEEKERLQREYSNYGILEDQWQIIITNLSLKWQQMGVNIGDLKLFEEVREDAIKIAEAFNYPPELLGKAEGSANLFGDNKKETIKSWYQDSIIPEVQAKIDALNTMFQTESQPYTIIATFDHMPMFQKDMKDNASMFAIVTNALSRAYQDQAITLEQYQAELRKYGFVE